MTEAYHQLTKAAGVKKLKALKHEAFREPVQAQCLWAEAARLEELAQLELPAQARRWTEVIGCYCAARQVEKARERLNTLPEEEQRKIKELLAERGELALQELG